MSRTLTFGDKQKQIILSPASRQLVSGSYRSGKSTAMLIKVVNICRFEPKSQFLIGRYFHADLVGDTYEILFHEQNGLLNKRLGKWNKQTKRFSFHNGSAIFFRHLDNSAGLKGMTLTGYYIEQAEQIKESVWQDIRSRLSGWGNPKSKSSPYSRYVMENAGNPNVRPTPSTYEFLGCNPDATSFIWKKFIGKEIKGWEQWHLTMWDNEINLGKEYIEQQIRDNNEIWVKRYVYGSWETAEGVIYTEFNDGHIRDYQSLSTYESQYGKSKFICVLDPGLSHKFGVIFALVTSKKKIIVVDEIYETGKIAQEMADLIKARILTFGRKPDLFIMDFAANKKDGTSGKSYQDIFRENGIITVNAKKNVIEGINEVKNALLKNMLSISRNCKNLKEEFQMYIWHKTEPDTPVKANDHLLDCVRYLVMETITVKEDPIEIPPPSSEFLQAAFHKSLVAKLNMSGREDSIWDLYKD